MRAAAILGPGNLAKSVARFQRDTGAQWTSLIEQADAVVLFGGDGTVRRHLSTLVDIGVPLLVVPCGGGNDFARALRLRKHRDSIAAWKGFVTGQENVRSIDLGVICASAPGPVLAGQETLLPAQEIRQYFCCAASVGLDCDIARRANRLPRWIRRSGGYGLCAPSEFFRFSPFAAKLTLHGPAVNGFRATTLIAVANAPAYGGGFRIAPKAKLDDGLLDVCAVKGMGLFRLFCLFPNARFGSHINFDEVEYSQTKALRIDTKAPRDVYADGDFICRTPVEFRVAPKALKVLVP